MGTHQTFCLEALRRMEPGACESDIRLAWKVDDECSVALLRLGDKETLVSFRFVGSREMKLLAAQLNALVDKIEHEQLTTVAVH